MGSARGWRSVGRTASYWIQWTGLTLFGPAQQDSEHDPIEILKRKYGRAPT